MTHAALAPLIDPKFDPFLAASIGEERNERTLSVLSALARSDVDPWIEATALASMPRQAAISRLAAIIAALPNLPERNRPATEVAADLIALLPTKGQSAAPAMRARLDLTTPIHWPANRAPMVVAGIVVLFLGLLAGRMLLEPSPEARPVESGAPTTAAKP